MRRNGNNNNKKKQQAPSRRNRKAARRKKEGVRITKNADNKQTKNTTEAKVRCLKREDTSKQGQIREGKEERRRKGKKKKKRAGRKNKRKETRMTNTVVEFGLLVCIVGGICRSHFMHSSSCCANLYFEEIKTKSTTSK